MPKSSHLLSIAVLGPIRDGLTDKLLRLILDRGAELHECRMSHLGETIALSCLVAGDWSALGRLEAALPGLAQQFNARALFYRTERHPEAPEYRPYHVDVVAPHAADLVTQLLVFFSSQGVVVTEINTQRYDSSHTGAHMCNLQMSVNVPVSQHPPALREAFMDLCDELNADGIMDPVKN